MSLCQCRTAEGHLFFCKFFRKEEFTTPKTKLESIVFTAITAWMMVYLMTLYNIVLASGTFVNATFWTALKTMWMEFILIFLCAYFLSSHVAKYFAFQRNFIMALPLQLFLVGPSPGSSSGCCSGG